MPAIFFLAPSIVWLTLPDNYLNVSSLLPAHYRALYSTHLFQHLGKMVLFWRCLPRGAPMLCVRLDATVGIEAADHTICFLQDLAALLEEGFHGVDDFLLIEFFFRLALS